MSRGLRVHALPAARRLLAANTFALVSTIGFAAAGAGAALAVVTPVVGHQEPAAPAASTPPETGLVVRPWAAPGSAGIAGTF